MPSSAGWVRTRGPEILLLALVLAVLPYPWLTLINAGGLSLKPTHVLIPLLALITVARLNFRLRQLDTLSLAVLAVYGIRLVFDATSLLWSPDPAFGLIEMLRQTVNFGLGLLLLVAVRQLSTHELYRGVALGTALQILATTGVFFLVLALAGQNPFTLVGGSLLQGDFRQIKQSLFLGALKALGVAGSLVNQREVSGNDANAFGSGLVLTVLFAVALRGYARKGPAKASAWLASSGRLQTAFLVVATAHAAFYVLIARSDRVNVFVLFALLLWGALSVLRAWMDRLRGRHVLVLVALIVVTAATPVALWMQRDEVTTAYVGLVDDPRFTDLERILPYVNDVPALGLGFGTPTGGAGGAIDVENRYPHNLWLYDLVSHGVLGIFTAGLWFGVLTVGAVVAILRAIGATTKAAAWRFRGAALGICYAIMTTQVATMGQLFLTAWVALALGLAFTEPRGDTTVTEQSRRARRMSSAMNPAGNPAT